MLKIIHSFSVKMRLAGFIFLLVMLLCFAGFAGFKGMQLSNNTLADIYDHQIKPLQELRQLKQTFNSGILYPIDRLLFNKITWEECQLEVHKSTEKIFNGWHNILDDWKNIKSKAENSESRKGSTEATILLSRTEDIISTLSIILSTKNREQLEQYSSNQLYPLADSYATTLDKLTEIILSEIEMKQKASKVTLTQSRDNFTRSILACIIISLSLSFLLMKSINTPLAKISNAMKHLMKGDLTKRLSYEWQDEFGILIDGFNQMTQYLAKLISEIEKSGIQVTSSITEIAATIKEQEATVTQQAATSNEIAASTSEIAATGGTLLATMKNVSTMSQTAARAASEGHHRLTKINDIMANMEKSTGIIVSELQTLGDKTSTITSVTKTINKIADQTNLLSLNAAIEAEKAGEFGTGFTVVSSEIRRLADQTAVASYDIEKMAEEVDSAISNGMISIENFAEDVKKSVVEIQISSKQIIDVIEKTQALEPPIDSLNDGISAQTYGAEQISESINQLNEGAQHTAESMSQTSNTIFQLNKAALILQDGVSRFKLKPGNSRMEKTGQFDQQ